MRRRDFLRYSASAALAWPTAAVAQVSKTYRVAWVGSTAPVADLGANPAFRTFVHALRALGYVEGENVILERRSAEGQFERYRDIFTELVGLKPDVIVTQTTRMVLAAKAVTTSVPIVMVATTDPVGRGIVASLAHPGGNITGLTYDTGPENETKRLQLLKEIVPGATTVGFLSTKEDWEDDPTAKTARAAAQALGLTLVLAAHTPTDYSAAFALLGQIHVDALFVAAEGYQYVNRKLIVDFARQSRLPDSHAFREAVEIGGLMSYAVSLTDHWRRAAIYVDKILKGAKPADLPIERPTKIELVINVKTAKALDLAIPPSILASADDVIE